MIDFSITSPAFGIRSRRRAVSPAPPAPATVDATATLELRTNNVRGAYREIIAAEDDGLPLDVRERTAFLDTRITIALSCSPTERDRAGFERLSQRLARFGPLCVRRPAA